VVEGEHVNCEHDPDCANGLNPFVTMICAPLTPGERRVKAILDVQPSPRTMINAGQREGRVIE
jgi:hypothetical protein